MKFNIHNIIQVESSNQDEYKKLKDEIINFSKDFENEIRKFCNDKNRIINISTSINRIN